MREVLESLTYSLSMCNILYGCYTNGRSHIGSRLEIICRMPVQMEAKSRVLSVTDIQGKWREKSSRSVWKVGIAVCLTAVSTPNFAIKASFESSRRDLHNALLWTAKKSHVFLKIS